VVASAFPGPNDDAALFELGHDLGYAPLRDADLLRNVAEPCIGVAGQADQHMCVVA